MRLFVAPSCSAARGARPARGRGRRARSPRRRAALTLELRARRRGRAAPRPAAGVVSAMFTGLVAELGTVAAVDATRRRRRACGSRRARRASCAEGDSVAVNGVCLTATSTPDGDASRPTSCTRRCAAPRSARLRAGRARSTSSSPLRAARPARRPHRPGPRRRRRRRRARSREDGFARRRADRRSPPSCCATWSRRARSRSTGVSLTVAARRRRRLRGLADPRDARAHDPRRGRAGRPRQPRGATCSPSTWSSCCRFERAIGSESRQPSDRAPFATDRGGDRGHPRAAGWSSSATTRTARTRATSTMAAQFATPEAINFMATHGARADLPGAHRRALRRARPRPDGGQERVAASRPPSRSRSRPREGVTTGISAARPRPHDPGRDRPATPSRDDLVQPGHVFPLKAKAGRRARAHRPDRGGGRPRPARRPDPGRRDLRDHERRRHDGPRRPTSIAYCEQHGLKMITVADLIAYRRRTEKLVERVVATAPADRVRRVHAPSATARWSTTSTTSRWSRATSPAQDDVLVRVHSRVPDRRRLPLAALRLRRAARGGAGDDRAARAAACCSTSPRRGAGSACSTSCAPTSSRRRASTPSTPTSSSACPPTCATTASARRSSVDLGLSSHPDPHQQPEEDRRPRGLRPVGHRPGPDRARAQPAQRGLPARQARPHGPHAPPPGPAARRGDDPRRAASATPASERRGAAWLTATSSRSSRRARARRRRRVRDLRRDASTRTSPSGSSTGAVEGFASWRAGAEVGRHLRGPRRLRAAAGREAAARESGRYAGVACLGAVIRGETDHYDYVCAEAARGIQHVQLDTGVPCAFGVLTCETMEQALARAGGGKRDQGRNAALAASACA